MDVRIGVTYLPKEIDIELEDKTDVKKLRAEIEKVLSTGTGMLWLTDRKGRQVGVPCDKVSFIEIGSPDSERHIGFGIV